MSCTRKWKRIVRYTCCMFFCLKKRGHGSRSKVPLDLSSEASLTLTFKDLCFRASPSFKSLERIPISRRQVQRYVPFTRRLCSFNKKWLLKIYTVHVCIHAKIKQNISKCNQTFRAEMWSARCVLTASYVAGDVICGKIGTHRIKLVWIPRQE